MVAKLIVLDTNVIVDLLEGTPRAETTKHFLESLGEDITLAYSLITRFELLAVPDVARSQSALEFIGHLAPLDLSLRIIDRAAALFKARHASRRQKIPDALIAATAIEHGADLLTHDQKDFKRIPGLTLLKP